MLGPILPWTHLLLSQESTVEVRQIIESRAMAYLHHRQIRVNQQLTCVANSKIIDVLDESHANCLLEEATENGWILANKLGDFLLRNSLSKVVVNVLKNAVNQSMVLFVQRRDETLA